MSLKNPSFLGDDSSSLDFWDPYKDFPFPSPSGQEKPASAHTQIAREWSWQENPEAYIFIYILPGFKKEEVNVQIENKYRVLQIKGTRNLVQEDKNDAMQPVPRSSVKFIRRLRLPENTNIRQVRASMTNESLCIFIPKA